MTSLQNLEELLSLKSLDLQQYGELRNFSGDITSLIGLEELRI